MLFRSLEIAPGDRIVADLMPPRSEKAHPMLAEIRTRNGAEFDYSKLYNGPSKMTELLLQLFYYLVVSFVMLSILTSVRRNYSMSRFVRRCLWCCVAAAALYCVAPVTEWHTGRIGLNSTSNLSKAIHPLGDYERIHCFLDNDKAGMEAVQELREEYGMRIRDASHIYGGYNDLNDFLCSKRSGQAERWQEKPEPEKRQRQARQPERKGKGIGM